MLELGILGLGLVFVIAWIVKSESRVNICKTEITRLNNRISSLEYEKFNAAPTQSPSDTDAAKPLREKNEALKEENKKLKSELAEAKTSLEEVYKALS